MRLGSVAGARGLCVNRRPQVPVMVMKAGGWTVLSEMLQIFELSSCLHHTTVVEWSDFDATAPDGPNRPHWGRVEAQTEASGGCHKQPLKVTNIGGFVLNFPHGCTRVSSVTPHGTHKMAVLGLFGPVFAPK